MMPGIFSHRSNPVYEPHRRYEILESPFADQFAVRKNPKRFMGKKICDFDARERFHAAMLIPCGMKRN
jgi:hypothetical protein